MADNVKYTEPGSGILFATKDDGTAHHQKVITEGLKADASVQQLAKQEDEAHATGDLGIQTLAVRKDSVAALAGADGDYIPLIVDASGRLWTNPSGVTQPISAAALPLPTGAATAALQGGGLPSALASDRLKVDGSGVTQPTQDTASRVDDAAFTPATDRVLMVGAEFDDATPDPVDEGDAGAIRMSGRRELYTQIRDAEGNERGVAVTASNELKIRGDVTPYLRFDDVTPILPSEDGYVSPRISSRGEQYVVLRDAAGNERGANVTAGGALQTDGSATTQPISAASLPLPTGAATATLQGAVDETAPGTDTASSGLNGRLQRIAQRLTSLISLLPTALVGGRLDVNLGAAPATVTVSGTVTAGNAAGDVAHGTGDSGNPVKIGAKAANAFPTAEANNDRVNAIADLFGRLLVTDIDPAMQVNKGVNYTAAQTGAVIWDPTAGKRIAITSIVIGSYGTTAARLILWFGANGDTTYNAGTDQLVMGVSFAPSANSKPGLTFTPRTPIYCQTADHELHITTDAALSVDIAVYGYEW